MTKIFRVDPPDELILKLLSFVGVNSLEDYHWWPKIVLNPFEKVESESKELLHELEKYYYPHKSFYINRKLTPTSFIQIIRQVLKSKNIRLESKEYHRSLSSIKCLQYRLVPLITLQKPDSNNLFTVSFN